MYKAGHESPLDVLDRLRANVSPIWVNERACTHGDLNASNVAIDPTADGRPRASVIDPGGVTPDIDFRDLAYLEVTTLLFHSSGEEHQLVRSCRGFYQAGLGDEGVTLTDRPTVFARNTAALVQAIRRHVARHRDATLYPVVVFEAVLRQLFGLCVQPKRNKVIHPLHARHLAVWVSEWAMRMRPDLFP